MDSSLRENTGKHSGFRPSPERRKAVLRRDRLDGATGTRRGGAQDSAEQPATGRSRLEWQRVQLCGAFPSGVSLPVVLGLMLPRHRIDAFRQAAGRQGTDHPDERCPARRLHPPHHLLGDGQAARLSGTQYRWDDLALHQRDDAASHHRLRRGAGVPSHRR